LTVFLEWVPGVAAPSFRVLRERMGSADLDSPS